jgi:hypothetical protein
MPVAIPMRAWEGDGGIEAADALDKCQCGAYRTLGIVLVRLRIPEIDEHPVAHIFRDKPAERVDLFGDGFVIISDQFAQILGVEPSRQCGRADEIAKHCGELPSFRTIGHLGSRRHYLRRLRSGSVGKGGDRIKEFTAVSDQTDPNISQVVSCQARQHRLINGVVGECSYVLRHIEAPQPFRNVHYRPEPSC